MISVKDQNRVGIDAILFALYLVSAPIHQVLLLPNGSTITKYLAFATMIACVAFGGVRELNNSVLWLLITIIVWFAVTMIWSRSLSASWTSLVSIISYLALFLIVCSKEWSDREKHLFILAIIVSCVYYGVLLIQAAATMKRASIISNESGKEADQNVLSANIGIAVLFAIDVLLKTNKRIIKASMIGAIVIIVSGIIATGSRGALIALAVSAIYYSQANGRINKKNKWIIVGIIFGVVVFLFILLSKNLLNNETVVSRYTTEVDDSHRFEIWKNYLKVLWDRPWGFLLGFGYGASNLEYGDYFNTKWPPATHSDYLHILFESGFIGLLFVLRLVNVVWKASKKTGNYIGNACVVLMLTAGLTVDMFTRYGWWNALIFAAIGIGVSNSNGTEEA